MEYIQCTHCGKRYEVSDQIKDAAGQFTTCSSCDEKFLIAVHDDEKRSSEKDSSISTGGWDPSLTMPEDVPQDTGEEESIAEYLDDDSDDGAAVLAELQAKRKKKKTLYVGIGLGVIILFAGVWLMLQEDTMQNNTVTQQPSKKVALSAQVQDANNPECRQAAALQWLLDTKAMHTNYSSETFVRMLKSSAQQTAQVQQVCKTPNLIQEIITAATNQEKPDWFKAEIEVIQNSRK